MGWKRGRGFEVWLTIGCSFGARVDVWRVVLERCRELLGMTVWVYWCVLNVIIGIIFVGLGERMVWLVVYVEERSDSRRKKKV